MSNSINDLLYIYETSEKYIDIYTRKQKNNAKLMYTFRMNE